MKPLLYFWSLIICEVTMDQATQTESFYNFNYQSIKNDEAISLKDYQGKVVLIVNTASACGFTPQYKELEELQQEFKDQLVVIGFPCNQFGSQESGNEEEIKTFCDLNFKISFPLSKKIEVNGEKSHPLFNYLKKNLPGVMGTNKIKWNFTKFLVNQSGQPVKRFAPSTTPSKIRPYIEELLKN